MSDTNTKENQSLAQPVDESSVASANESKDDSMDDLILSLMSLAQEDPKDTPAAELAPEDKAHAHRLAREALERIRSNTR